MAATTKACDRKRSFIARTSTRIGLCAAVLAFAQTAAFGATSSFQTLAQRLPAASNAIVAINVKKVLSSPYGKREHWAANVSDAWAKQPVMIPPGATRMLLAANVKTSNMESYWEMSLLEMDKVPSVQELAAKEGGHIDRVWDKDAVYSPINAYFVPLDNSILASITPAERSEIARWVRQPVKPEGVVTSTYINSVVATLGDKTDMVMAMDLEGAFGLPNIHKFITDNDIKEIPPEKLAPTVQLLGTLNGITLEVTVGDSVTARATVGFDQDATLLKDSAKPVMLAVLKRVGMLEEDAQDWKFTVIGKTISMQGNLSSRGLRDLMGMVQSPIPAATVAATGDSTDAKPTNATAASQRYYKTIDTCVKSLGEGASAKATAISFRNTAKRIEQLPILGVDPALVQWGNTMVVGLKEAASVLGVGQVQINSRVEGVRDPEYATYTYDGTGAVYTNSATLNDNANAERRQAAAQVRSDTYQKALVILNDLAASSSKIRAQMTEKYNAEF